MSTPRMFRIALLTAAAALGLSATEATAEWKLPELNPFAEKAPSAAQQQRDLHRYNNEPSALEKLNAGTKSLVVGTADGAKRIVLGAADGTQKLLTGTKEALTFGKPAPSRKEPPKPAWFDGLFAPKPKHKPIKSLDDWWDLKKMEY